MSHKKVMGAFMSSGIGKGHKAKPTASLHANKQYGTPVLMSGFCTLVLKHLNNQLLDKVEISEE